MNKSNSQYVGAIDQGTTSTRFILFDRGGRSIGSYQREHRQIFPRAGWVEHDPLEIWDRTVQVIRKTLKATGVSPRQIAAVGITNQRETTVAWNLRSGLPYGNAVVWQDTRTAELVLVISSKVRSCPSRSRTPSPSVSSQPNSVRRALALSGS